MKPAEFTWFRESDKNVHTIGAHYATAECWCGWTSHTWPGDSFHLVTEIVAHRLDHLEGKIEGG